MSKPSNCKHERNPAWCVECRYRSGTERDYEDNPIDAVEEMNRAKGRMNSIPDPKFRKRSAP